MTATNSTTTDRERAQAAIRHCDELIKILEEETRLIKNRDYDALTRTAARTAEIEPVLQEIIDAGIALDSQDPIAQNLRDAQKRLSDAVEHNRRINQAHQDAVNKLLDIVRRSAAEAEDDGTYTADPAKRQPRGRHGMKKDI